MNSLSANPRNDLIYQKAILGSVSRTFALTIPLLPPALEKVVGNTYLLCRIIDTIEDASQIQAQEKQTLSQLFLDAVLGAKPAKSFIEESLSALKGYPNEDELDLIAHTDTVLRVLHTCPKIDQAAVCKCVAIMSEGMSRFHSKQSIDGLKDLHEFEEYCYVVAGVVGELLTTIFMNHSPEFAKNIHGHQDLALDFGQALQMTNILKDSPEDRDRGVSWKPALISQSELLVIAYQKLQASLRYNLLIPKREVGMRRFCFLALGLAIMTLEKIAQRDQHQNLYSIKLTRNTVTIFYFFNQIACNSDALMRCFFYLFSRRLRQYQRKHPK